MLANRRLLPLLLLLLALAPSVEAQQTSAAPTVVIVVRHGEKEQQGSDPALTPAGAARARALAAALKDAGVSAIYSSQFRRTRETVQPLADALGVPVTVFPIQGATEAYPPALAAEILAKHRGKTVAVVNHSNTVPQIVRALSGVEIAEITDPEYDHLFVVILPPDGPARVLRTQYGHTGATGQPNGDGMLRGN